MSLRSTSTLAGTVYLCMLAVVRASANDQTTPASSGWLLELVVLSAILLATIAVLSILLWRTHRALAKSRESFDLALRGGDLGLFDWDILEARVTYNRRWAELLGYRLDELDSHIRSWESMIHPDDLARVKRTIEGHVRSPAQLGVVELLNATKHGTASLFEVEYRIRARTDQWKWVILRGRVFEWDEDGNPLRVVGTHQDVTQHKLADDELRVRLDYEAATASCAQVLLQAESLPRSLDLVLRKLVQTVGVSRAYLFENFEDADRGTCMRQRHEAVAEGISAQMGNPELECVPYEGAFSDLKETLEADKVFQAIVKDLPPEKRAVLASQGILSIIILPIFVQRDLWGFIGFDDCVEERTWRSRDISVLRTVASLLSGALERANAERLASVQRDLSNALSMESDFDSALRLCISAALDGTHVDGAAILLKHPGSGVQLAAQEGFGEPFLQAAGQLGTECADQYLSDSPSYLEAEELPESLRHVAVSEGYLLVAMIPIRDDEATVACFLAASRTSDVFPRASRDTLETIAGQIGGAITRLEAEEALKRSEERHRELVEEINDVIFALDLDGAVTYVSPALERFSRYRAEDVVGHHFCDFVYPEDVDDFNIRLEDALKGKSRSFDFRVMDVDGNVEYVRTSMQPVIQDGDIVGARGAMTNITEHVTGERERRRLLEQLRHGQKMESLGKLAGGIAHHFNNLLQGILGHTSLALEELPVHSETHDSIAEVQKIAERAANLSNQMLAFSGRGKFVVKTVDVGAFLSETEHLLRVTAGSSADLRIPLPRGLPKVRIDAGQVRQALVQLVANAVEACAGGEGVVALSASAQWCDAAYLATVTAQENLAEGEYVVINVEDTGHGMDDEAVTRAFEPFFSTRHTGRGLGLSMVIGVMRGHHGGVQIESAPGQGTTVRMLFPTGEGGGDAVVDVESTGRWRTTGVALIADDEDVVTDVLERMLRSMGFDVIVTRDGRQTVDAFDEHSARIRVVILDLLMPELNGIEVYRQIRARDPHVPVLISSGYNEQNAEDLPEELADTFLHKPYEIGVLRSRLRHVLGE